MTELSQLVFEKRDGFRVTDDGEYSSNDVSWIFVLRGPEGAVTFDVTRARKGTGLAEIYDQFPEMHPADESGARWFGWDVGVHAAVQPVHDFYYKNVGCEVLGGGQTCWYDGSGLAAEGLLKVWMQSGMDNEVIRAELWGWYKYRFLEEEP